MQNQEFLTYKTEKNLLIQQMWNIVLFNTAKDGEVIDDAGCDWFTIDNCTYIGSTEWLVSENIEVARLVNAINMLNGSNDLINKYNEIPIETAICKYCNEEMEATSLEYDNGNMCIPCYMKTDEYKKETSNNR
ncbi:hypothetical protein U0X36_25920 [Bacillus thuringiensis]|uniref:Uncharacterized protein n=1 Tax=Bacillus cereus (strain VD146) TaxID=1053236 RepID=R8MD63_BACCX|nr:MULTISPECIES: hypothetical protein [Bacillus cereus group]EOP32340.1 hypothetical protein IK1_05876 [Bacillus cereus VD146]MDZ3956252.1 hypothetical protein [Bacillus thuringiensis]